MAIRSVARTSCPLSRSVPLPTQRGHLARCLGSVRSRPARAGCPRPSGRDARATKRVPRVSAGSCATGRPGPPISYFALPAAVAILARKGMGKDQLSPFQTGRYSAWLVPMFVLIRITGACVFSTAAGEYAGSVARTSRLVMPFVLLAAAMSVYHPQLDMATRYAWQVQNINAMQVELGKWAASLPENTVLARQRCRCYTIFLAQADNRHCWGRKPRGISVFEEIFAQKRRQAERTAGILGMAQA